MTRPLVKPIRPEFSSGPCAKRPGWSLNVLKESSLGRSHRHKVCKNKLKEVILQIAERGKYDLILTNADVTYASDKTGINITDKVLKEFNSK